MHKFFSLHTRVPYLYRGWTTDSLAGLLGGMVMAVILAVLFEYQHVVRSSQDFKSERFQTKTQQLKKKAIYMLKGALLHSVRVLTGYIMMLIVMTMNAWFLVSVITGSAIGYFFFRPWTQGHGKLMYTSASVGNGVSNKPLLSTSGHEDRQNENLQHTELLHTPECHNETDI